MALKNGRLASDPEVSSAADVGSENNLEERWHAAGPEGVPLRQVLLEDLRRGEKAPADLRGVSLMSEDLEGLDFSGCDLSGANLSGADLSGAKFFRSTLRETNLARARLEGCEFLGADLRSADLNECRAGNASFGGADLSHTNCFQAVLQGVTLSRAKMSHADIRVAQLKGAKIHKADLSEADFTRADLREADFSESDVSGATFVYSDLRGARLKRIKNFERAEWIGADIRDMDLYGAYQLRRYIMDENYLHEFRSQSRFKAVLYWIWWLTSNCGRSFSRWALWTAGIVVVFAALYSLVDINFGEHRSSPLTCLYYSVVTITTLGYGDIIPRSGTAKLIVIGEVAIGYLTLGGLISILANKMARRAE